MPDGINVLLAAGEALRDSGAPEAEQFDKSLQAFMNGADLAEAFGLNGEPGKRSARTRYQAQQRRLHLLKAWAAIGPDLSPTTRAEKLAESLGDEALSPTHYFDVDWAAEPWSRGCNSFMTTGVWTVWGHSLRNAQGRVHFAGAEMSPKFYGQMDGAVRTGETVAAEIISRLER